MRTDRYEYHRFNNHYCLVKLEEAHTNEFAGACVYYLSVGFLAAGATYIFFFL